MLWTALRPKASLSWSEQSEESHGQSSYDWLGYREVGVSSCGVDESGTVVVRRRLIRAKMLSFFAQLPSCLVGLEACATAHHWGRELTRLGRDVRPMPPSYVKAYLKSQKNDAADAEATCEAITRP